MAWLLLQAIALIVATPHAASTANTAANGYHLGSIEITSLSIGMGIFAVLSILIARDSYRRRKETEKRVAEWLKTEEQVKHRMANLHIEREQQSIKNTPQNA